MAQRLIPVRPSPLSTRKSGRRLGPPFSPPAWAESSPKRRQPFIADQRLSATLARTKLRRADRMPKTLGHSPFLPASLLPSEQRCGRNDREREMAAGDQPAGGVAPPAGPLAGVRCSPEGERAAVEPARGSALSKTIYGQS
jgi:hypothetical protein